MFQYCSGPSQQAEGQKERHDLRRAFLFGGADASLPIIAKKGRWIGAVRRMKKIHCHKEVPALPVRQKTKISLSCKQQSSPLAKAPNEMPFFCMVYRLHRKKFRNKMDLSIEESQQTRKVGA